MKLEIDNNIGKKAPSKALKSKSNLHSWVNNKETAVKTPRRYIS